MKSTAKIKLEDAIENAENYIAQLKAMDDKKLSKHLDLFRIQMQQEYQQKTYTAYELLYLHEKQIITSRANQK